MSKSILMSAVAAALLVCGIAASGTSSVAKAAVSRADAGAQVVAPGALQLHPPQVDCRFVACADDSDCAITPGCAANSCSNRATGQGFGRCTVRPQ